MLIMMRLVTSRHTRRQHCWRLTLQVNKRRGQTPILMCKRERRILVHHRCPSVIRIRCPWLTTLQSPTPVIAPNPVTRLMVFRLPKIHLLIGLQVSDTWRLIMDWPFNSYCFLRWCWCSRRLINHPPTKATTKRRQCCYSSGAGCT